MRKSTLIGITTVALVISGCVFEERCVGGATRGDDGVCIRADGSVPDSGSDGGVPDTDSGRTDGGRDAGSPDGGLDAGPLDSGPDSCATGSRCVPVVPTEWTGPFSVGEGALNAPPCPSSYPTEHEALHRDLTAPPASCSCGCSLGGVSCDLASTMSGRVFVPSGSCDDPLMEEDCLEAQANATCTTSPSTTVPPLVWGAAARSCEGTPGASCEAGGSCFAQPESGQRLCIARAGDHPCPAPFADRTLYHAGVTDTRGCSACGCTASGAACTIEIEVCSVAFYTVTLSSATANETCLPPASDGDGVSLLSTSINSTGSCTSSGGAQTGGASATGPQTYCCLF